MKLNELLKVSDYQAELVAIEMDQIAKMHGKYALDVLVEEARKRFEDEERDLAMVMIGIEVGNNMRAYEEMRRDECINNSKHN